MQESDHEAAARTVYDHSATKFVAAIGTKVSSQFETPLDRAVLQAFAESVLALGSGPVLDVGCGPGRIAANLGAVWQELDRVLHDDGQGLVAFQAELSHETTPQAFLLFARR